jgi:septin 2
MQDMQVVTHDTHYENYRLETLSQRRHNLKPQKLPTPNIPHHEEIEDEKEQKLLEKEKELEKMQKMVEMMQKQLQSQNSMSSNEKSWNF